MSNYYIGGWTQLLNAVPPASFSYTMYGMITNLDDLKTGPPNSSGGWGPETTPPPPVSGNVIWTYGGEGAGPANMPETTDDIEAIVAATNDQEWDGVDFDDESTFDIDQVVTTMQQLGDLEMSYTFLAGWAYNNPGQSSSGATINASVKSVAESNACDRFVLMCYGGTMWDMTTIQSNVPDAIKTTIDYTGDSKQVVLALTTDGLTSDNLNYFLEQVTEYDLGGLFIWKFENLSPEYLETIESTLGITVDAVETDELEQDSFSC